VLGKEIPKQMRALVLDLEGKEYAAGRGFALRQVPTPSLNEKSQPFDSEQVILKTIYAGVCGSDKGLWFRNAFGELITKSLKQENKSWRIPGHEFLGEIVEMGSAAREKFPFRPGEVVSAEAHLFCDECYPCHVGDRHVCQKTVNCGFTIDGCFAEYIKLPVKVLWKVDTAKIRPEVAVLYDPFGNAVHACGVVPLANKRVLISGCGTIGLFAVLVAKEMGAKQVIGVDTDPKRLQYAKALGADTTFQLEAQPSLPPYATNVKLKADVRKITDDIGVDVAMEMAGLNGSVNNVIQCTRRGGDVILFGLKSGDFVIQNFEEIIYRGKNLHSVVGRRVFETWEQSQKLFESHPEIQKKIYEVMLNSGKGTVMPIAEFSPEKFEKSVLESIKLLVKF
jgi:threonine 3-dehydrogenase